MAKKRKAAKPPVEKPEAEQPDEPKLTTDLEDIHKEALERYERGFLHDRHNSEAAYEDLRFLVDEENAQWDAKALKQRIDDGRPALTVNKCPQFVRQVTGDIRQLRPSIKCVPVDDDADDEVAEVTLPGMIRYIENRSDAKGAYFAAADTQVAAGIGHLRVLTEYASEQTFNQEIRIAAIRDGIAVVWDPDAERPCREDAMWCFVPVDLSQAAFKEQWPDCSPDPLPTVSEFYNDWFTDDQVRVSEYWRKVPTKRKFVILPSGTVEDVTDAEPDILAEAEAAGLKVEERDGFKVERYLITATEVCDGPDEWPGPDIPITPVIGEEISVGPKRMRRGVVRVLKDSQRAYNYAFSLETEVIALQPKAPFIGTRKNFEKHADQWETANSKNWPYLEYEPDQSNGGKAPQREAPPQGSVGLQQLMETTSTDMHSVTGIYPASLGAKSNETSGKAIMARQREGDTGTFVYIENFGRAVRRVGQIVVNLIPYVYDTERVLRIVGEDGKHDKLEINKAALHDDGVTPIVMHDVTVGAYDVVIEMGPSFSTKREEARDGIQAFMQAAPNAAPMFIDLFAKMQDWPLADKVAQRAKLLLPPAVQAAEAAESGEPPPQMPGPQPPSPEQQMAAERHQAEIGGLQATHQLKTQEAQAGLELKAQEIQARREHDAAQLQLQLQKQQSDAALAQQELQQNYELAIARLNGELELKNRECEARLQMDRETRDLKMVDQKEARQTEKPSAVVQLGSDDAAKGVSDAVTGLAEIVRQNAEVMSQASEAVLVAAQSMAAPRQVKVRREANGDLVGESHVTGPQ